MDCGPTCLRMIAKYYGKHYSAESLRLSNIYSKEGVSMLGLCEAGEQLGFKTTGVAMSIDELLSQVTTPAILHWRSSHFVVFVPFNQGEELSDRIQIIDPESGRRIISRSELMESWISKKGEGGETGMALLLEPTILFYEKADEKDFSINFRFLFKYLRNVRWPLLQVFVALLVSSLLQLIFPVLMQGLVDTGVRTKNLDFITMILIGQMVLIFSRTIIDFIRTRLLLVVSSVINLSLLSDFWIKVTKLPISYFDTYHTGDIMQRVSDNKQLQSFITSSALNTLFSIFNFVIFSFTLLKYNSLLFIIFCVGSMLNFLWVNVFLRFRRKLNYENFHLSAQENNSTLQLVQGMQEIKLHNAERIKRWEWEGIQASLYKLNLRRLTINQLQQTGALFISQGKDVVITFIVARLVVQGELTFGAMLAIQYIIGQLGNPIEQLIAFVQSGQDAKISLERLNDIHKMNDEETSNHLYLGPQAPAMNIVFRHFTFAYAGASDIPVLRNISFEIEAGKTTAIVGASGSGKTTILKLLLQFYNNYRGELQVGDMPLKDIAPSYWRSQCGAVLQTGYIFDDSIRQNICLGHETIDHQRLLHACRMANILDFIESLPNAFDTRLGTNGATISQGQKQRILIAREVYKDPQYIFFDEATNSLDAHNETEIVSNLQQYFVGKTVVIVAHRLSTVRHADKIIVLDKGRIVEQGTHESLKEQGGAYFELIKNQFDTVTLKS